MPWPLLGVALSTNTGQLGMHSLAELGQGVCELINNEDDSYKLFHGITERGFRYYFAAVPGPAWL